MFGRYVELAGRLAVRGHGDERHGPDLAARARAEVTLIRNRFDVYEKETAPVLGAFDAKLIIEVDAIGTIEEVFDRTKAAVMTVRQ